MNFFKRILSIFGKLGVMLILLATFVFGAGGVLLMALRSPEVKVPQVVGKDFFESEKELAALGLKIKKRTDRFSQEKINTVLEQLPLEGDSVKIGQTINVVTSREFAEGDEKPAEVKKETVDEKKNKTKDIDEPSEVDKARQKRKAVNANTNANNKNTNAKTNSNGNANSGNSNAGNSNSNAGNSNGGNTNSNTRGNSNGGNSNARPANSNANKSNSNSSGGNKNSNSNKNSSNRN